MYTDRPDERKKNKKTCLKKITFHELQTEEKMATFNDKLTFVLA